MVAQQVEPPTRLDQQVPRERYPEQGAAGDESSRHRRIGSAGPAAHEVIVGQHDGVTARAKGLTEDVGRRDPNPTGRAAANQQRRPDAFTAQGYDDDHLDGQVREDGQAGVDDGGQHDGNVRPGVGN